MSKRQKGSGSKAQSKNGAATAASSEPVQTSTSASASNVDHAAAADSGEAKAAGKANGTGAKQHGVKNGSSSSPGVEGESNGEPAMDLIQRRVHFSL